MIHLRRTALAAGLLLSFTVGAPLMTLLLLAMKGLPSFAKGQPVELVLWIFQATGMAAALSGLLVAIVVLTVTSITRFFHDPYDVGRCISLGAVTGALAEAAATWLFRTISHRPFSTFWIAGAAIAGCLVGAAAVALLLKGCGIRRSPISA